MLSRRIAGSQASLLVGVTGVIVGALIGSALGMVAAFYGRRVDEGVMAIADVQLSFPFILLAIAILAVLGRPCLTSWSW